LEQNIEWEETRVSSLLFVATEYHSRIRRLRQRLLRAGADALVVTHLPNIFYLTGFLGSAGILVVDQRRATLITDGRYRVQAREQVRAAGVTLEIPQGAILAAVGKHLASRKERGSIRVVFDPNSVTVAAQRDLAHTVGRRVTWRSEAGWVEELRAIKSPAEIIKMRAAARLISKVFEQTVELIRPGVTELDLAAEAEYRMRKLGAEGPSFETIVASGSRAALPHARPTTKRLARNELVVFDAGAILSGYCSDMTRTVFVGRAPERVKRWYRAVLEAQSAASEAVAEGIQAGVPDAAARQVLESHRLGKYFVHSTGHGLGLEVHEEPRLAKGQTKLILPGMVVTIEPGIYMAGVGGIRIEDEVAVFNGKTEILTTATRELLEL
jgi:Xaa-Pro aminopeptidase